MRISNMEPYSTLEVRQVEQHDTHDRDESTKEVVSQYSGLYQDHGVFSNGRNNNYHVLGQLAGGRDTEDPQENPPPGLKYRTCGFHSLWKTKSRVVLLVFLIVVVLGGAIAGGVTGGLLRRDRESEQQPPSPPHKGSPDDSTRAGNILGTSRLATSNWTDAEGVAHRTVFFQDPNSAIIARRWDSVGRSWTTSNITDILTSGSKNDSNTSPPIPGTPLASAAYSQNGASGIQVWYLTAAGGTDDTRIVSGAGLLKPRSKPDNWAREGFAGQQTAPGSQLAAAWQRCLSPGCIGTWLLSYQTPEGHINVANASGWDYPARIIDRQSVSANSSLSMIPQFTRKTGVIDRVALTFESTTSNTKGAMKKMMFTEEEWISESFLLSEGLPLPSPGLQFAITLLHNFVHTMFLILLPDGIVTGVYWDDGWHTIPRIDFRGGPSSPGSGSESDSSAVKFSAIAAGEDAVLYGITGDQVLAYESAANGDTEVDVSVFTYVDRVYP